MLISAVAAAEGAIPVGRPAQAAPVPWPELREELRLHRAGDNPDGSPAWHVADPVANRYCRIGWLEFEMLARWHLGDAAQIAASYNRRWTNRKGIMRGYCETILQRDKPATDIAIARDLVGTVEANIRTFLSGRPHSVIRLEHWREDLPRFFFDIGAEVDLEAALSSFAEVHNPSRRSSPLVRGRYWVSRRIDALEALLKRKR